MEGKQFTDLTKASALKDTNIIAVHDGNGLKNQVWKMLQYTWQINSETKTY